MDGELQGPNPEYTVDLPTALRSVAKLTQYDIATVICYHGGCYDRDPNRRIAELSQAGQG